MKPKKRRPPRPVPVLTSAQEALLSAITDSKQFDLETVLARHASVAHIASKLSDPKNTHLFTKEAAHTAFAHLKPTDPDLQSQHTTPAGGNVFTDLGFPPDEAAQLLAEADRKITLLAMKEASIARTLADASAALKAGTLKRLTTSAQSRRIRVRTPLFEKTRTVLATVFIILADFKQVRVKTADGFQYAITEETSGVNWQSLHEGQRIECTVTTSLLPKVLKATALPHFMEPKK
ncbi:MAG: hypothetical protein V4858_06485 [Pseudomonadota bacterium]